MPKTRQTTLDDVEAITAILNEIIAIGGTTAYETPRSLDYMAENFVTSPELISSFVAEGAVGAVCGVQVLYRDEDPTRRIGYIASFARQNEPVSGTGRALMEATTAVARDSGIEIIEAKIRADNASGLGFYAHMGFRDHRVDEAVPLKDGTPVDRIVKRLAL